MHRGTMPQGRPIDISPGGRLRGWPVLVLALSLELSFSPTAAVAQALISPLAVEVRPECQDAELTDICFIDPTHGWAVGDRGVIWHTDNGGRAWRLQASGVTCRLTSVQFLDAQQGWIGGGDGLPPGDLSRGVVLSTRDGGNSWQAVPRLALPAIRRLRFVNARQGWCLGETSGLYPAGVATTEDGGRTWDALTGSGVRGWLTGDLLDPKTGALAGASGTLAAVRRRAIEVGKNPPLGLRAIHALRLAPENRGWLVGDAGLVLATSDAGRTWQVPAGELPAIANQFNWHTVAIVGSHVWIAGSPGSMVLHSADDGGTWSLSSTGQSLPLGSLSFIDAKQGWAAGALGTVLATSDGGRTWRPQRSGGKRAAWLTVFGEPTDLPLELWGRLAASEGYLGAAEFIVRRDTTLDAPRELVLADRARQALIELGAASVDTAWRFPLPPRGLPITAGQLLDRWNQANDGRAIELLEQQLVRTVRTWRPDVVITHPAYPRGDHPLEHLINQAVLRAVEAAADPTRHSEQLAEQGLEAWRAKKVIGGPVVPRPDTIRMQTAELVPRLSQSLAELTEMPRMLLNEPAPEPGREIAFRLLFDRIPQRAGSKDFFAGIVLPPGGDARRAMAAPDAGAMESSRQLAVRTRNLHAILARSTQSDRTGAEVVGAIGGLVDGLEGPLAGRVLYRLAQDYVRQGEWELAAEMMNLLPQRYPQHPLAGAALAWQVAYGASSEIDWRRNKNERLLAQRIAASEPGDVQGEPPADRPADLRQPVQAASLVERANRIGIDHERADRPTQYAVDAAKRLEAIDPARAREPAVMLPLARAYRGLGLRHDADRLLLQVKQNRPRDAWSNCAAGELWLARPEGICPKPTVACARAMARPRLDGVLDDAVWQQAVRIDLLGASPDREARPAAALLAYDSEYLYFAVSCRRARGVDYQSVEAARPRDADLTGRDRIELLLDLDRDAATWFRLSVDDRGWTNDACGDDVKWNPQWYVAAETVDDVWTVEAAIGLDQLTREYPHPKSVWAIGLQRVVPGVGFQSWTRPAAPTIVPEGFGYLIFD